VIGQSSALLKRSSNSGPRAFSRIRMTRCITVFKFLNYTRLETVSQNNALIGIGSCRRVSINSAARPLSCFQRLSTDIATTIRPSLVLHNPLFQCKYIQVISCEVVEQGSCKGIRTLRFRFHSFDKGTKTGKLSV